MNADPTSLDRLHDIVVPRPVPLWPPAPAWYWVIGFLLLVVLVLVLALFLYWQRNRYRREALALWRQECHSLNDPATRGPGLVRLAELLKRTALSVFPRDQVAGLTGTAWFGFLDRTASGSAFTSSDGKPLEDAAYDSRVASTIDEAMARRSANSVRHWIRYHRINRLRNKEGESRTRIRDEEKVPC